MRFILCTMIAMALVACSSGLDRKIDGTTEKTFETSLATIKKSATADEVGRLDDALLVMAISNVSIGFEGGILGAFSKISARRPEQLGYQLAPVVDGMTGREVIKAGQKRKEDEIAKQLGRIETELAKLTKQRDEYASIKGILAPIRIVEPRLRFNSAGSEKMSVIDFTVNNGSDIALTYLYLRGTVNEKATGKVLFSGDINYKLSAAPLMQGESKTLRLPHATPDKWNAPAIWGNENIVFSIDVVNAENLAGQKLAAAFTQKDMGRMIALEGDKVALTQLRAK